MVLKEILSGIGYSCCFRLGRQTFLPGRPLGEQTRLMSVVFLTFSRIFGVHFFRFFEVVQFVSRSFRQFYPYVCLKYILILCVPSCLIPDINSRSDQHTYTQTHNRRLVGTTTTDKCTNVGRLSS